MKRFTATILVLKIDGDFDDGSLFFCFPPCIYLYGLNKSLGSGLLFFSSEHVIVLHALRHVFVGSVPFFDALQ